VVNVEPFEILGQSITGATSIRDLYSKADQAQRQQIIKDLYGKYTHEAEKIMNDNLLPAVAVEPAPLPNKTKLQKVTVPKEQPVAEAISHFVPSKPNSEHGYYKLLAYRYKKNPGSLSAKEKQELHDFVNSLKAVKESGGTGVVANKKQARDPRYSTSLTKDVQPGQIKKSLRAFNLAEEDIAWARNRLSESEVDNLILTHIKYINQDIDAIKQRISTEKLPADYVEKLKQKITDLEQQRVKLMFNPT
jgi:hypothetical protein